MTSAIFQSDGKVEVPSEQLIISVIGPSITCRASLNTLALVLSGPGALFNGIPANSHACGLKTSISRRLTLAGQFLTSD